MHPEHRTPGRCKICDGTALSILGHTARCGDCGVLLYYPYPEGSQPNFVTEDEKLRWYSASAQHNHDNFTHMLRYATDGLPMEAPLSILDFGGGGGQFATICKSLFPRASVYLVDINDSSALDGWTPFSHRIPFAGFAADDTVFDVIFLNDVFEHVDDPVGTLQLLAAKLKDKGTIFIDTPRQFWIYPLTRLLSPKVHLKLLRGTVSHAHLQIWSGRAFRVATERAGLRTLRSSTWAEFTMPWEFYVNNYGHYQTAAAACGPHHVRGVALDPAQQNCLRAGEIATRILILGGDGMLGHQLLRHFRDTHETRVTLRRPLADYAIYGVVDAGQAVGDVDVRNFARVAQVTADFRPDAIICATAKEGAGSDNGDSVTPRSC